MVFSFWGKGEVLELVWVLASWLVPLALLEVSVALVLLLGLPSKEERLLAGRSSELLSWLSVSSLAPSFEKGRMMAECSRESEC
jgi:hypothetical protein